MTKALSHVTFFHFNDVYNADKPTCAKFVALLKKNREEALANKKAVWTVFSGDCWSPSIMTTILRGEQMVPVMNLLEIDVACLGNHDLDLGLAEFENLKNQCNFLWICSNVTLKTTGKPLGNCEEYVVLEKDDGLKILFVGIIEDGWIEAVATIEPEDICIEEFTHYCKRRIPELVTKHQPDLVVALSHMRMPNDYKLAEECGGLVDLILGGHDHHYEDTVRNNVRILNSGSDFDEFSKVDIKGRREDLGIPEGGIFEPLDTQAFRCVVPKDGPDDPRVLRALKHMKAQVEAGMEAIVGNTKVDLDARFSQIRTKETNISNFLADLMRRDSDADVALLNAGTLRADRIIPKGPVKVRDLFDLLPMADGLAVVEITGHNLLRAFENGVSKYPAMEGRFPCLSGVRLQFDPRKEPGNRIVAGSVMINSRCDGDGVYQPIVMDKKYKLISRAYLLGAKDGYESFADCPVIHDDEIFAALPTVFRNIFTELSTLKQWQGFTVQGTVLNAANAFKSKIRARSGSVVDPYAIRPMVDGRLVNVAEVESQLKNHVDSTPASILSPSACFA